MRLLERTGIHTQASQTSLDATRQLTGGKGICKCPREHHSPAEDAEDDQNDQDSNDQIPLLIPM